MIETIHLQPPALGPRSNPVLFGIAEAIAALVPLPRAAESATTRADDGASDRLAASPAASWVDGSGSRNAGRR